MLPTIANTRLPVPKSWGEFEDITADVLRVLWEDNFLTRNGRNGQRQNGVDIYGRPAKLDGEYAGAQCKNSQVTLEEVRTAVLEAESFKPPLKQFILSIGAPRDAKLQEQVRMMDIERVRNGKFAVTLFCWDDLTLVLTGDRQLFQKHFPQFADEGKHIESTLSLRRDHSRLLTEKPLDEIKRNLEHADNILMVWVQGATNQIARRRIDIDAEISPNAQFFLNHLRTGYRDLYATIEDYEKSFNELVDRELATYGKVLTAMNDFAALQEGVHWEVSAARCVEAFSQMIEVEIGRGGKHQLAIVETPSRVRLGSYIIAHTDDDDASSKLAKRINSLFEDENIIQELKRIARESQDSLAKVRRLIDNQLEDIRALVLSNVPLEGWCRGGETGGYERR